jgi:hypothetical protein
VSINFPNADSSTRYVAFSQVKGSLGKDGLVRPIREITFATSKASKGFLETGCGPRTGSGFRGSEGAPRRAKVPAFVRDLPAALFMMIQVSEGIISAEWTTLALLGASHGARGADASTKSSEITAGTSSTAIASRTSTSSTSGDANLGMPMTYFKLSMLLRSNEDTE